MELVGEGRDCQMFDAGPGRLLRRARNGRSIESEARIIRYLHARAFPVPEIYDVSEDGTEIVMERIEGPNMGDALLKEPWKVRAYGRRLADLHDLLHEIPPPDWPDFRSMGSGDALVHLDFHPLNVIVSPRGPVVIDWMNAAKGDPLLDAALTYLLLTVPEMPGPAWLNKLIRLPRGLLARSFAGRYRSRRFDEQLDIAGQLKALDGNLSASETAACLKLSEKARRRIAAAG